MRNKKYLGKTISHWSKELNVNKSTLRQRLYVYKWPIERVFSTYGSVKKEFSYSRKGKPGYWLGKKRPNITGTNHYLWNGRTPIMERVRKSSEYSRWRRFVFERDNYTCQMCFKKGGRLHADHIKQFAFIMHENNITSLKEAFSCKEIWDTRNGRTLCRNCHRSLPAFSYFGSRKIVFIKDKLDYSYGA